MALSAGLNLVYCLIAGHQDFYGRAVRLKKVVMSAREMSHQGYLAQICS